MIYYDYELVIKRKDQFYDRQIQAFWMRESLENWFRRCPSLKDWCVITVGCVFEKNVEYRGPFKFFIHIGIKHCFLHSNKLSKVFDIRLTADRIRRWMRMYRLECPYPPFTYQLRIMNGEKEK